MVGSFGQRLRKMAVGVGVVAPMEAVVVLGGGRRQRRLRSLYLKLRAELRRQVGGGCAVRRQRPSFRYDPSSYALNFDDGCYGFLC